MTRRRRVLGSVAALLAAAVVLTGCLFAPAPAPRSTVSPAPDTTGVAADLLPFYGQALEWAECGELLDCATVRVPLDWADPGAAEIPLALIRHRASDGEPIGSLLTNPGGPGSSGVQLVRSGLSTATRMPLQARYDIVGFDPRGVGDSAAVRCFDPAEMDDYLYGILPGERGSAERDAAADAENRRFAEACDARSGGILPFLSTENAARDMDVIRAVLGQTRLDYLGYSYGTFLGATYAGLYPDRVGRMVLDGGLDPAASSLEVSTQQGIGFESSLRAFMADCLGRGDCPFSGTVDEAMTDLGTLLASVDRSPLPNADGRSLGADSLMTAIVAALYSPGSWQALRQAFSEALQGRAGAALLLADVYNARTGGQYADNTTEAFRAYNCTDYPRDFSPVEIADAQERLAAGAPTVARYWSGREPCLVWPHPPTGERAPIAADGAPPIVVVGTTSDPATPYAWSVALADELSSGVLVTRVGEGHTGYNKGNACVDDAVEGYLLDGRVPDEGLRCG